jgi:hypothetical protein
MPMIGSSAPRQRSWRDDVMGGLATLNRSIPLGDEMADGLQALENVRSGRADNLQGGWDLARAASASAAQGFEQAHPTVAALTKGAGLALQALPFMMTGGAAGVPAAAARQGMIGAAGRAAVAGGLGAQAGGLASEGSLEDRVGAANAATPASMAFGAALPIGARLAGAAADLAGQAMAPKPVASLAGDEVAPLDASRKDLRDAMRDYYNTKLRGMAVPMAAPDGPLVGFNQRGRNKSLSFSGDPNKLRAFPALPQAISGGQVISSGPPHKDVSPEVKAFHVVEAPIEVGGERRPMHVLIRETTDGHFHYDHTLPPQPAPPPPTGALDRILQALSGAQGSGQGSK